VNKGSKAQYGGYGNINGGAVTTTTTTKRVQRDEQIINSIIIYLLPKAL